MGNETTRYFGFLMIGVGVGATLMSLLVIFNELMTEGIC